MAMPRKRRAAISGREYDRIIDCFDEGNTNDEIAAAFGRSAVTIERFRSVVRPVRRVRR